MGPRGGGWGPREAPVDGSDLCGRGPRRERQGCRARRGGAVDGRAELVLLGSEEVTLVRGRDGHERYRRDHA